MEHLGQRTMSKIGYVDWDIVVQKAEANLAIIADNKKRAEMGKMTEELMLEFALKERDKYPKPEQKKEDKIKS